MIMMPTRAMIVRTIMEGLKVQRWGRWEQKECLTIGRIMMLTMICHTRLYQL